MLMGSKPRLFKLQKKYHGEDLLVTCPLLQPSMSFTFVKAVAGLEEEATRSCGCRGVAGSLGGTGGVACCCCPERKVR